MNSDNSGTDIFGSNKPKEKCCDNNCLLCWCLLGVAVIIIMAGAYHEMHKREVSEPNKVAPAEPIQPQPPVPIWDQKTEKWMLPNERGEYNFGVDRNKIPPGSRIRKQGGTGEVVP